MRDILPIKRDELEIYGILYMPDIHTDRCPLVILCHGLGSCHSEIEHYAKWFSDSGIACYVFDFCGGGPYTKSSLTMKDMSLATEVEDALCVLDHMKDMDGVDPENIFLMGESQGGAVAALVAAERQKDIKGLILMYPAFSISGDVKRKYRSVDEIPDEPVMFHYIVGKKYFTDAWDVDMYAKCTSYGKNVLIFHGDCDDIVPLSYSEKAAEEYTNAELVVFNGALHGFNNGDIFKTAEMSIDFVKKNI